MNDEDADMDSMITTFNTAVIETSSEILSKHGRKTKLSVAVENSVVRLKKSLGRMTARGHANS